MFCKELTCSNHNDYKFLIFIRINGNTKKLKCARCAWIPNWVTCARATFRNPFKTRIFIPCSFTSQKRNSVQWTIFNFTEK